MVIKLKIMKTSLKKRYIFFMKKQNKINDTTESVMPLNKFLSISGVCSRRNAVELIKSGLVEVNDVVITEPGYKVSPQDTVKCKSKLVRKQKKVYILLNKPKDYITTSRDEKGRRMVLDLLQGVVKERIYPVGRLDRFTTGLLLLTNDGELSQRLAHPSFEVKKVYTALLDQPLAHEDLFKIKKGVLLKDGLIAADKVFYIPGKSRKNVRIQLHSGKNKVVRRIFKKLGYNVVKLDRINYAGLTKKGLSLGRWRFLKKEEIQELLHYGGVIQRAKKDKKTKNKLIK